MAVGRKDNSEWKSSIPKEGASTEEWKNFGKANPNRTAQAKKAKKATDKTPTTMSKEGTPKRDKVVRTWRANMPQGGAGIAKDEAGATSRRKEFIKWASWNPNRADNANRAIEEDKKKK
jgi:hypothetical protein